jgi:hypothetical protein
MRVGEQDSVEAVERALLALEVAGHVDQKPDTRLDEQRALEPLGAAPPGRPT